MRSLLLTALCAVSILSGAGAQTASFQTFGQGCPGSAVPWCVSNNATQTKMQPFANIGYPQYALEAVAAGPVVFQSFELLTRATGKTTTNAFVFLPDKTGAPQAAPIATGTITVTRTAGWHRASFSTPVVVPGGKFFLSWQQATTKKAFLDPIAGAGTTSPHYFRPCCTGAWTGPKTATRWAWRVTCISGGAAPVLGNTGLPRLGSNFSFDLSGALPNAPSFLINGLSTTTWGLIPLPLDLTRAGAAGCKLLVSFDLVSATVSDATGAASVPFSLPNDARLIGFKLHGQWMTLDKPANGLGLAFSNGGTATLGR